MASKKRQALGRGLDALLSSSSDAGDDGTSEMDAQDFAPQVDIEDSGQESGFSGAQAAGVGSSSGQNGGASLPRQIEVDENGTLWVEARLLKPNPHQPRHTFDEAALNELAESIRENGIVQPITIEDAGDGTFYIIAGERRTRAAMIAGQEKVPVQLRKFNSTKKLEVALIENLQRADLNPIEEAEAYHNLMRIGGLTQDQVAQRVGKGRPTVANALRLLKLPDDMRAALSEGKISAGHARALLAVLNPADQRVLFEKMTGSDLSVRQAESLAASFNEGGRAAAVAPKKSAQPQKDADIVRVEEEFMRRLGTKVQLKGGFDKGSLVIDFFSRADLDRLYDIIVGSEQ